MKSFLCYQYSNSILILLLLQNLQAVRWAPFLEMAKSGKSDNAVVRRI
jgi:hypothetical protein